MVLMVVRFVFVNSIRISHFGEKPDSGGRPAKDNSTIIIITSIVGEFGQANPRSVIDFAVDVSSVINIEVVIII